MENRDTRSLSGDAQEALRIRAVNAVLAGRKQVEVAAFFGISRQALSEWLKAYALHGQTGLQTKRKGRRPGGRILKSLQISQICQAIKEHCPDHFNLPFYLWTREAVGLFIEQEYRINVSIWTVRRYLDNWGFTFSKPVISVDESDTSMIGHWLRQDYPIIRQCAKSEKATIYWIDKVELCPDCTMEPQHFKSEQSSAILQAKNEKPYSMIYAITNLGQFNFMVFKKKPSTDDFMIFFDRLIKHVNRKIVLLMNGYNFIHEQSVESWMENNCNKVKLHFLPG
jgi:transposase